VYRRVVEACAGEGSVAPGEGVVGVFVEAELRFTTEDTEGHRGLQLAQRQGIAKQIGESFSFLLSSVSSVSSVVNALPQLRSNRLLKYSDLRANEALELPHCWE